MPDVDMSMSCPVPGARLGCKYVIVDGYRYGGDLTDEGVERIVINAPEGAVSHRRSRPSVWMQARQRRIFSGSLGNRDIDQAL
ncbi:MAG: hypothetical protein U0176_26540 [Bacteroidia bacterium]